MRDTVYQGRWILVMSIVAILALPAVLLEYYFTKERVTEEGAESTSATNKYSMAAQLKACLSSKYWMIVIGIIVIYQLLNNFQVTSTLYYCNWVLGTYNDGITMTMVNAIGQAPLGIGIVVLWPLVRKFGKRNIMIVGFVIGIIGCLAGFFQPHNMGGVLGALTLKSFGTLPITYLQLALLADALDHVEWKNGFRADGLSSAVYSIIVTVAAGISIGLFNLGLGITGYIPPAEDGTWVTQSASVQNLFVWGLFMIPAICYVVIAFLISSYHGDKEIPKMQTEITEKHKAEAEVRGEIYISPAEKAKIEQEELDRFAEDKRVEELRSYCRKKGLSFEAEEAKYQEKLAAKQAKADVKKRKK
jgi:GPH family glycoside/pentoside/hexuronide:cation symporter